MDNEQDGVSASKNSKPAFIKAPDRDLTRGSKATPKGFHGLEQGAKLNHLIGLTFKGLKGAWRGLGGGGAV